MPGSIGNKNKLGKKHPGRGGRPSAYQEKANAELLHKMFLGKVSQDEIEEAIRSGKFSLQERFLLNGMEGDTRILTAIFNKLFPDKMDLGVEKRLKIDI